MLGEHSRSEAYAVLTAFKNVRNAGWPDLAPTLIARAGKWPSLDETALRAELRALMDEFSRPDETRRLFWKFGDDLIYRGYNPAFLRDSGFTAPDRLLGNNDLDPEIGWARQGAKYRADDFDVLRGAPGVRDIIERQDQHNETVWVHTAKCAVRTVSGEAIGVLGMYELIDASTAARLQRRK